MATHIFIQRDGRCDDLVEAASSREPTLKIAFLITFSANDNFSQIQFIGYFFHIGLESSH